MLTTQSEMNASGCIGATPPAQPCTINNSSLSEAKKTHVSEQSVKASISFSSLSHEASEGDNVLLSCHLAFLVNLRTNAHKLRFVMEIVKKVGRRNLLQQFRSEQRHGPLM